MASFQWSAFSCRREAEDLAAGMLESPPKQLSAGIKSPDLSLSVRKSPLGCGQLPSMLMCLLLSREAEQQPAWFRAQSGGGGSLARGARGRARAGRAPPEVSSTAAALSCHGDPSHREQFG